MHHHRNPFSAEPLEPRRLFASLPSGFTDQPVATDLDSPTSASLLPDSRILIAEQTGSLRIVKDNQLLPTPALTLPVNSDGERGLLGVTPDPDFSSNHFIYLYYTTPTPFLHNRISRFTLDSDTISPDSEFVLMDLDALSATNHNGGAIHFGPDGKLYVGVGENAVGSNAQSLDNRLGKILRLNPDGSIPTDNPFYTTAAGDNRAIYAIGLRNPFSLAFQPGSTRMLINDVGQNQFEEIDEGIAGANYGWPATEGPTTNPDFTSPIFSYTHAGGSSAITAGTFYNPTTPNFPSQYIGSYFFADLSGGYIKRLTFPTGPSTPAVTPFATGVGSLVDLDVSPTGDLYYLRIGEGDLRRIHFNATPSTTTPTITLSGPKPNALFNAGQKYTYSARAAASNRKPLPPSSFTWQVELHDGDTTTPFGSPVTGKKKFTLSIPSTQTSTTAFFRLLLTVTDSSGATRTVTRDLRPHLVKVTLKPSIPALHLSFDNQSPAAGPQTFTALARSKHTLSTETPQESAGLTYDFLRWSDGSKKLTRPLTLPTHPLTLTALFRRPK